jgi:hypothetical protein
VRRQLDCGGILIVASPGLRRHPDCSGILIAASTGLLRLWIATAHSHCSGSVGERTQLAATTGKRRHPEGRASGWRWHPDFGKTRIVAEVGLRWLSDRTDIRIAAAPVGDTRIPPTPDCVGIRVTVALGWRRHPDLHPDCRYAFEKSVEVSKSL